MKAGNPYIFKNWQIILGFIWVCVVKTGSPQMVAEELLLGNLNMDGGERGSRKPWEFEEKRFWQL